MATVAEPHEAVSAAPPVPREEGVDVRLIGKQLDEMLRTSPDDVEATRRFVRFTRRLMSSMAVVYFGRDSTGCLGADPTCCDPERLADSTIQQLYALALRTEQQQTAQLAQASGDDRRLAFALPVFCRDGQIEVLLAVAAEKSEINTAALQIQLLQLVANYMGQWRRNGWSTQHVASVSDDDRRRVTTMLMTDRTESFRDAATAIAQHFTQYPSVQSVALCLRRTGGLCRLIAVAPEMQFERGAALVTAFEAYTAEMIGAGVNQHRLSITDETRPTDAAGEVLAISKAAVVDGLPLRDAKGMTVGALVVMSDGSPSDALRETWRADADVLGPHLSALQLRRRSPWQTIRERLAKLSARQRRVGLTGLGITLLAASTIPVPTRVKCLCEIQPAVRRYVTAPYAGILKQTYVEPGDLVTESQPLAQMDDTQLLLDEESLQNRIAGTEAEEKMAWGNGNFNARDQARSKKNSEQKDLENIRARLENLEIKSPLAGIVISGDLRRMQGASVAAGQTLFEVAPLDRMTVEVAIPDQDIEQVNVGAPVDIRLDSLPFTTFQGRLTRVSSRAELRANHNVFIGEVEFAQQQADLRPGMHGHAKIAAERHCFVWIFFHRAIERLLFRIGW